MTTKILVLCALGAILVVCIRVPASNNEVMTDTILEKLRSEDPSERQGAVVLAMKRRNQLIHDVLEVAKEANDTNVLYGTKECAIHLLGQFKATEAIPFLIEHIDIRTDGAQFDVSEFRGLPSVEALVLIGNPAAKAIWHGYLFRSSKERLPYYLKVMKGVWGRNICLFLLNDKLKTETRADARATLQAALDHPVLQTETTEW